MSSPTAASERMHHAVSKRAVLVFAVLNDLILLVYSLLIGKTSLEQAQAQLREASVQRQVDVSKDRDEKDNPLTQNSEQAHSEKPEEPWVSAISGLCRAIVKRDVELVSRALNAAPCLAKTRHDALWYPLHAAVLSGNVDIVKLVLAQPGIDVCVVDKSTSDTCNKLVRDEELGICTGATTKGATPLHYACMVGNIDIIKELLERDAAFYAVDDKGRAPVDYFDVRLHVDVLAAYHELFEQWRERKEHYADSNTVGSLADMIRENKFERFETALQKKPELASKFTSHNYTLLHLAVIRQLPRFVALLISTAPSTLNKRDGRDDYTGEASHNAFAPPRFPHQYVKVATPLHYACLTGNVEIIDLLFKAGAVWESKDFKGRTPEELIYERGENGNYVKTEFRRLRDEEDEKRKKAEADAAEHKRQCEEDERRKKAEADAAKENDEGSEKPDETKAKDDSTKSGNSDEDEGESESEPDEEEKQPEKEPPKPRPLEVVLGEKLIGQRGPIRSVANAIRLRENGWVDPDRPLVMLFLGSSGVGKTELAKQVALHLHGKDGLATDKGKTVNEIEQSFGFVRIDMSEFQQKHTVANLTGSPKGYVLSLQGYDDEGFLTRRLRKNPKAIVLLDEIEKAHPDVLTVFLQVFDDGRITDSKVRLYRGVIYCKDAVFIMTSNLASDEIKEKAPFLRALVAETEAQGRPEEYMRIVGQFNRSIHPILKRELKRDEFLGRINQFVVFLPLSQEEIGTVIKGELDIWRRRAQEKHAIKLSWANEVVQKLASAYDVNYGVRSVANEVQRIAVQLIADAQIQGRITKNWHAYLTTNDLGDINLKSSDFRELTVLEEIIRIEAEKGLWGETNLSIRAAT
ncbi:P-loop containing nucleoside triphosphate hydrolase protein [Phellopilus nigrolimitatus]|nr:P-loop containing nucleoside triphosphate hydrolase protein [Phellopilus nigrolimitatus]